jgi:hypothetical protein
MMQQVEQQWLQTFPACCAVLVVAALRDTRDALAVAAARDECSCRAERSTRCRAPARRSQQLLAGHDLAAKDQVT